MSKLWAPKADYQAFHPKSIDDFREADFYLERFLPYERLYENLTSEELMELFQDAKRLHWRALDLRCCGLNALPKELWELENLYVLALGNASYSLRGKENQFVALPDSIALLTNLQALYLSNTQIRVLPDSIGQLSNLQSLDLSGSDIRVLPDSVGQLNHLQALFLSGTNIRSFPEPIERLSSLRALYLSETAIQTLPDWLGKLTNLQALLLGGTEIRCLPDSIGHLTNLQMLFLDNTRICALPDSIGQLRNLQTLFLSGAEIRSLPDSIERLRNLQTLDLSGCHLKAIPYSAVSLGLPFIIGEERIQEQGIRLYGVTLDKGDLQLFAQPREVIEAAYRKQTQIRECKVIFLGDGGAGKTALIERITKGTFTPGTPPTDGIETTKWFMSVDMTKWETQVKDEPFTVRFLDFGGQEIMHAAHRCFLTAHTVYVVVCESRDDTEIDSAAARWLESVRAFAPDCPVILALNKADLNANVSVNERDLRKRNPNLKCVLKTSAHDEPESRYGANRLIEAIRDEIPGAVNHYQFNADMIGVKRALEDMGDDYISSERYREICAEHHITDEQLQYSMLGFFRDLGVAYYYETDAFDTRLESVRVLNPEWLTNGIYRLILRTPESGFLRHKTIKETLRASHAGDIHSDITYSPEETEYILHVMRCFEISHDMGGGVEIIPLKMSKTTPESADSFPKENALHLRWEGAYLPNNLIHRLLIRKFPELDTECVWRTGGRFRQAGGGCEALAEMNEKALDVYVSGDRDCRPYLDTFRVVVQKILSDLNLKTSEVICCTADGQEGYVPYEDVVQQYYDKREEIYIPGIRKYRNPAELLRDTYYNWEQEAEKRRLSMERGASVAPTPSLSPAPTDETPENQLQTQKTRAEIANIRADTVMKYVKFALIVGAFLALLVVAVNYPDKLPEIWNLLKGFFGGD